MVEQGWGEVLRDCCLHLEPGSSLQAGRDALLVSWKCGSHAVRSRRGSICFVSGSLKFSKTQLKKYQKKLEMKYVCDRSRMNAYKLFLCTVETSTRAWLHETSDSGSYNG